MADDGQPVACTVSDEEQQKIISRIVQARGLRPRIRVENRGRKHILAIHVEPTTIPTHCRGRYFMRVSPEDKPGVLGRICGVLGEHGISIASCFQRENEEDGFVHVVLITHETVEADVRAAVAEIDALDYVRAASHVLRVL